MKLLCIFLLFYAHYIHLSSTNEINLLSYVCKVAENILKADSDTKDVAIGYFNSKLSLDFYNGVVECTSRHSIVMTSDYKRPVENKNMRKAQLVIIISDIPNLVI